MPDDEGTGHWIEPTVALAELCYHDGLKPYAEALGDVGRIVTLPVSWLRSKLEPTIERVRRKVPKDKLANPPKFVAVPLLNALPAAEDEPNLRELYEEVLGKLMHRDHQRKVHPAYVSLLGQLSPDEAALIHGFREPDNYPFLRLVATERTPPNRIVGYVHCVAIMPHPTLLEPDSVDLYISNFMRLGLLEHRSDVMLSDEEKYSQFEALDAVRQLRKRHAVDASLTANTDVFEVTSFGAGFIDAVLGSESPTDAMETARAHVLKDVTVLTSDAPESER